MVESSQTALLLIRLWHEQGSERSFRAQIRIATDLSSGFASTLNVADPERVIETVRAFLDARLPSTADGASR